MTTKTKSTALATVPSAEVLSELRQSFPTEVGFTRVSLPRLGMVSQDKTEGKGKAKKVITEAGTFFIDEQTDEEDENGKKIWNKTEIGTEIEGIIFFYRKQLKYYDETTETYTSSSVYDEDDEIIPLFCNKAEIAKGTPQELKARPEYQVEKKGKIKSRLEDNRILYVLYKGTVYQMNLRGTSMYSWMTYVRKVLSPSILTTISSESKENGQVEWNQMTFVESRKLSAKEVQEVQEKLNETRNAIRDEKHFFGRTSASASAEALAKF